jgi:hypothetical protein
MDVFILHAYNVTTMCVLSRRLQANGLLYTIDMLPPSDGQNSVGTALPRVGGVTD